VGYRQGFSMPRKAFRYRAKRRHANRQQVALAPGLAN
jgi:hypothetical protein